MYSEIFAVIAPIFICALLGYIWGRSGQPFDNEFVSRIVMWIGVPCLIIGKLSEVELSLQLIQDVAVAWIIVMALTAVMAWILSRLSGLDPRTYLLPMVYGNTGFVGLPLTFFAFGSEGLAIALVIFSIMMVSHFSLGIAYINKRPVFSSFAKSPVFYAVVVAITLIIFNLKLPIWLQNTFSILVGFPIPLMLITLGVSLSQLRVRDFSMSLRIACGRLLIGFAIGWLVSEMLALEGMIRGVVIIQSAMPVALFNYLLAHQFKREPEQVASSVVLSTLLSFISLPLLIWFTLQQI